MFLNEMAASEVGFKRSMGSLNENLNRVCDLHETCCVYRGFVD